MRQMCQGRVLYEEVFVLIRIAGPLITESVSSHQRSESVTVILNRATVSVAIEPLPALPGVMGNPQLHETMECQSGGSRTLSTRFR